MKRLVERAAGTLGLRVFYTLVTFITSVMLARLLGADGFGTYAYATSWTYLLAIPATVGFDGLLGRELAIYETKFAWNHMRGLLRWANLLALSISTVIAACAAVTWYITKANDDPQLVVCFALAMCALPLMALRNIRRGAMRGLHKIVYGLMPEMLVAPSLLLVLIGCTSFWLQKELNAPWAVGAYALATAVSLFLSAVFLERFLPFNVTRAFPYYYRLSWIKQAWPFMFIESIHVINARADILMIGSLSGVEAAGIYAPVNRGAQLIVFVLMAFNGPLSPTIASLYADGKTEELQRILNRSVRICLLVSGVATALLLSFGRQYLLIFGPEFVIGLNALTVLCVGRVLYVFVGLSSALLSMTGQAQFTAISGFLGAMINVGLNALLIPQFGVSGAAIATTSGVLVAGIINTGWAYRKLGIYPNIFGKT
ncbi:MAG: flippase [Cyanobacteria bacterium P01_F01_bin.3]